MSTFRGVVQEFPDIRIDFFRPVLGLRPPKRCFLSHVHSDHLTGLESPSFHNCFIYCSAATREILLRLEKQTHRLNFHQGILEKRKFTYKHLNRLVKTIPLETPTRIELEPGNDIQVTLFDANHCTGAVMFLIEGGNKAILYTGDIRSEPWFVTNLTRNPFLIEYTSRLKRLDCIYLDTSNIKDIPFPPKADGLKELLQKVSKYPADTVFHFAAWTFGYEEVWMALSRALKSQIHVDDYKMRLYASLRGKPNDPKDPTHEAHVSGPFLTHEGPVLTGYKCGNDPQAGCLTSNPNVRIHSCEKRLRCHMINEKTVWIRPIITRAANGDISEVGCRGGRDDIDRHFEVELDRVDVIEQLLDSLADTEDPVKTDVKQILVEGFRFRRIVLRSDDMGNPSTNGDISLRQFVEALARSALDRKRPALDEGLTDRLELETFPRFITFPYSRHSSYAELCHLVKVFNPKDVYPCTVDEINWDEDVSMETLFGRECEANNFRHDDEMRALQEELKLKVSSQQTHTTVTNEGSSQIMLLGSPAQPKDMLSQNGPLQQTAQSAKHCFVQRNTHVRHRLLNTDEDELISPAKEVGKVMDEETGESTREGVQARPVDKVCGETSGQMLTTPPKKINAVSPGSASQHLRRKAIHDVLEGQLKRARLSFDDSHSSQSALESSATDRKEEHPTAVIDMLNRSDGDDALIEGSKDKISVQFKETLCNPKWEASSEISEFEKEESQSSSDPYVRNFDMGWVDPDTGDDPTVYLDRDNEDVRNTILRCKECGHEMWTMWMTWVGFCTGCNPLINGEEIESLEAAHQCPYYEIIDSRDFSRPGIEVADISTYHITEAGSRSRKNIVGDYIDDHSDAYDTFDEVPDHRSEYDSEDSFIDDAGIHESQNEDEDDPSSDTEQEKVKDYKVMFQKLQRKHSRLVGKYQGMMQDLADSGFQYDSSSSEESYLLANADIEEVEEYGGLTVVTRPPDPMVVELVLSEARQYSQDSQLSQGRLRDRVMAFEAAIGEEWNNISLVSTGHDHSHPEIEL